MGCCARCGCVSASPCSSAALRPAQQPLLFQSAGLVKKGSASSAQRGFTASSSNQRRPQRGLQAHRVEIETEKGLVVLEVGPGDTILQAALDQGVELSHDCKMGVCMTCPAKLVRC